MAKPAKISDLGRAPYHRLSDSEVLLFVSRTLQPPLNDAGAPTVFAKLQGLSDILQRQAAILPALPDGPGKDRMAQAVASAGTLVAEIVDALTGAAKNVAAAPAAKSA